MEKTLSAEKRSGTPKAQDGLQIRISARRKHTDTNFFAAP